MQKTTANFDPESPLNSMGKILFNPKFEYIL